MRPNGVVGPRHTVHFHRVKYRDYCVGGWRLPGSDARNESLTGLAAGMACPVAPLSPPRTRSVKVASTRHWCLSSLMDDRDDSGVDLKASNRRTCIGAQQVCVCDRSVHVNLQPASTSKKKKIKYIAPTSASTYVGSQVLRKLPTALGRTPGHCLPFDTTRRCLSTPFQSTHDKASCRPCSLTLTPESSSPLFRLLFCLALQARWLP